MRLNAFQGSRRGGRPLREAVRNVYTPASTPGRGRRRMGVLIPTAGVPVLVALAFGVLALAFSSPAIVADAGALARVDSPLTGGRIESVRVRGPHGRAIPIALRGGRLWPLVALTPGEPVSVEVVFRRPGWIAWLAGGSDRELLRLRTPSAHLRERYLTLSAGSPLRLAFDGPVRTLSYGQPGHLRSRTFAHPRSQITLARTGEAGSIEVAGAPRAWERPPAPSLVSWFPVGAGASAVLSPRPGSAISPRTPISLTLSRPIAATLDRAPPRLVPAASGRWHVIDSHTLVFEPSGYGFGLGATVTLALPGTVRLVGDPRAGSSNAASFTVPAGSTLRAQQILAQLGYLPLRFDAAHAVPQTIAAQANAATNPPAGSFSWRYGAVPASLRGLWQAGSDNVVTRGALMAFENAHNLTTDGIAGPVVWRALIGAMIADQRASGGYTYVMVNERSQSLSLWHDGSIRLSTPVNTGVAAAPTARGTFPVFEHIASGTMSGTNVNGSHYKDPGVPWISYFNGGDALHGFYRAQYGFPQSLGCVEIPVATAGRVWPYTPIGTLVHVE